MITKQVSFITTNQSVGLGFHDLFTNSKHVSYKWVWLCAYLYTLTHCTDKPTCVCKQYHTFLVLKWVWLTKEAGIRLGFVHRSINGCCSMKACRQQQTLICAYLYTTDKWVWLFVCLQTLILISGRGSQKKLGC